MDYLDEGLINERGSIFMNIIYIAAIVLFALFLYFMLVSAYTGSETLKNNSSNLTSLKSNGIWGFLSEKPNNDFLMYSIILALICIIAVTLILIFFVYLKIKNINNDGTGKINKPQNQAEENIEKIQFYNDPKVISEYDSNKDNKNKIEIIKEANKKDMAELSPVIKNPEIEKRINPNDLEYTKKDREDLSPIIKNKTQTNDIVDIFEKRISMNDAEYTKSLSTNKKENYTPSKYINNLSNNKTPPKIIENKIYNPKEVSLEQKQDDKSFISLFGKNFLPGKKIEPKLPEKQIPKTVPIEPSIEIKPAQVIQKNEEKGEDKFYIEYNKRILNLINEANRSMDLKNIDNAKSVYKEIKEWYDPKGDKNQEIYKKIITLYDRISKGK